MSRDAEIALLAAAMLNGDKLMAVELAPEHFADDATREVFCRMRRLASTGNPVDPVTVSDGTRDAAVMAVIGEAGSSMASSSNISSYADQVRKSWRLREIHRLCAEGHKIADEHRDPDEALSALMSGATELGRTTRGHEYGMQELMAKASERVDRAQRMHQQGKTTGVPFGISRLDSLMGGMHPGHLIVVGARPKMGKTAFMLSTCLHAARMGYRVGVVSAEMPADQLVDRLLCHVTGIEFSRIRSGAMTQTEIENVTKATSSLASLRIRMMDQPGCGPADVMRQARCWSVAGGLDLLVVDYLQRLRPDAALRRASREEQVASMAYEMKTTAATAGVPLMLLAQVGRKVEDRTDKRPIMSDLRESGAVEQEADQIMFLYRDAVYTGSERDESAEILLEGNRHGRTGVVRARFVGSRMAWVDERVASYEGAA
ncbi:MAG: AAA family ATPase [Ectothiorhodospiraceae bacterium]|nr:AAA family ATPase [Ectothiorhodospiraceae bacterium]